MKKEGWVKKRIKDVCQKASSNIAQNKISENNGTYPIYGASGYIKDIDFYQRKESYIGIVKDGSGVGRVNIYPAYSSLLGTMQYIIPNSECNISFLAYLLRSLNLSSFASGAAIPHIYFKDYGECKIYIPSLSEQQQIVSELDCLQGIINKKKAQLQELDKLAQSIFYTMFGDPVENEKGWDIKKIGDIVKSVNYGTSTPATENGEYKYLRMNNLTYEGFLDLTKLKYISIDEKEYEKCVVRKGDILFNRTNSKELVGKTALFNLNEEMIIAGYIIRVRVIENIISPVFVVKYMNTPYIKSYLSNLCKGAVNQANINSKELQRIPIPVPPLSLQQEFADKITAIEQQKERIQKSLQDTETLFQSRMDYYFG